MTELIRRGILARLLVNSVNHIRESKFAAKFFDPTLDELVIGSAIIVGMAENKPLTASDIAAYTGLSRPTIIRKLRKMQLFGVIAFEKDGARSPVVIRKFESAEYLAKIESEVHRTAKFLLELSKTDT